MNFAWISRKLGTKSLTILYAAITILQSKSIQHVDIRILKIESYAMHEY